MKPLEIMITSHNNFKIVIIIDRKDNQKINKTYSEKLQQGNSTVGWIFDCPSKTYMARKIQFFSHFH